MSPARVPDPMPAADRFRGRHPLIVVLDNIRSAHNVGSILRTADALAVELVICCGFTPSPNHPSVAKTALGAEESVAWLSSDDALAPLVTLREEGFTLVALEQTASSNSVESIRPSHFPLALVLGNEVSGVQKRVLEVCDLAIELPQYGAKNSLNVAVAFGVAGYGLVGRLRA